MSTVNKAERRQGRETAIQAIFAFFSREEEISVEECYRHVLEEVNEKKEDVFASMLVEKTSENMGKLKVIVRAYAPEFAFDKIAPINRAILLVGLTELRFSDTPPVVVINEYIEIAKEYGEQKSASFVNGVLDAFRKNIGKEREENVET